MMFINSSYDNLKANHCATCVYRRKSLTYERSADRQSAETRTHRIDGSVTEITAYPTFIMLSAINYSLCIMPVMCCRNVIDFFTAILQYLPLHARKCCLIRKESQIKNGD